MNTEHAYVIYAKPPMPSGWATEEDIAKLFRSFKVIGVRFSKKDADELAAKHKHAKVRRVATQ
ncbi:hypothetical protein Dxin01_00150 [Deinococcus xinjiangensis]|uniref:RRM domain-containing protein n=1 Tax=Deinococcus xinjiangensis TaxID=457454 RepID=A0ABP9V5E6_9DEIO